MDKEGAQNPEEMVINKERILANPAFMRFAAGFEMYQGMVKGNEKKADRDLIIKRMRELYAPRANPDNDTNENSNKLREGLKKLILTTLDECERGEFSSANFAEKISEPVICDLFTKEWNRTESEIEEGSGIVHVNEIIGYKLDNHGTLSLHLRPSGIQSKLINKKFIEGFRAIKRLLEIGEIKTEKIIMKSWMFGRVYENRTRLWLGQEIPILDVPQDDEESDGIQFLALQYNNPSLRVYLESGKKPEVREIILTKEEFLQLNV